MSVVEVVDGGQDLRARRISESNGLRIIVSAVVEIMVAIFRLLSPELPQVIQNTPKAEQFRARQRRMLRKNQRQFDSTANSRAGSLEEHEGRRRKISPNWCQKQKQLQFSSLHDDGNWPQSAGTEMHVGYNAFDFSMCPEAFITEEEPELRHQDAMGSLSQFSKNNLNFDAANCDFCHEAAATIGSVAVPSTCTACFTRHIVLYLGTRDEPFQVDVLPLAALISGRSFTCRTISPISATTGPPGGMQLSWDKIRWPGNLQVVIDPPIPESEHESFIAQLTTMYQDSQPAISPSKTQFSNASAAIEQFRVRQRQLCRGKQQQHKQLSADSLEVEEGRTRKIPANWLQKQEKAQSRYGYEDGNWPKAAGTEMYIGFNAFDFSSCPEALYDMEELEDNQAESCQDNQQLNYMPTSTSTSLWGLLTLRQSSGPSPFDLQVRSVPEHGERRRAVCNKLQ